MKPKVGQRFLHRRVLTVDKLEPMVYEVTKVALGAVYYRPVCSTPVKSEWCQIEDFERLVVKEWLQ